MRKFIVSLILILGIFILYNPTVLAPNVVNRTELEHLANKERQRLKHLEFQIEFERFLVDLGYCESRNNWKIYNKFGYIGEWQLGKLALQETGYSHITYKNFKKDPNIFPKSEQKKAVTILISLNIKYLGNAIDNYNGQTIKGVEITTSGLIAAAHLAGARGVKLFLASDGRINRKDANGTSVLTYLTVFQEYNI